jgi:hypothetical protein
MRQRSFRDLDEGKASGKEGAWWVTEEEEEEEEEEERRNNGFRQGS